MTQSVSFSIITPFYNRKEPLLRAVRSVLAQSYQSYELILIDDASTDGTLHSLSLRHADKIATGQIKLFRCLAPQGAAKARNCALKMATNPWIFYLDSDNYLYSDALEILAHAIMQHPYSQIFYGCCDMASNGKMGHAIPFDWQRLLQANFIDLGVFTHRREIYENCGGFDTKLKRLMDWDLIIRYTQNQEPVFIPSSLMIYNDSLTDTSRITIKESLDEARSYIQKKHATLFNASLNFDAKTP